MTYKKYETNSAVYRFSPTSVKECVENKMQELFSFRLYLLPLISSTAHLLKWLSRVPTSSPMRLSLAGTMPCRHTTRSLLSLVWNTTSWSFPGDTLTPVTWDTGRQGALNKDKHAYTAARAIQTLSHDHLCCRHKYDAYTGYR